MAGRRLGFGLRRAALAARFARHRGADDAAAGASWIAGLLAEIGLVAVVIPPDATAVTRLLAMADAPLYAARIIASLPGLPSHAADIVRWHREHEDGTGFPDRLRWDGIPADAAALGIVNAFLEAVEDPDEPRSPGEAMFTILAENGRRFRVEAARAFREFVARNPTGWDDADPPALAPMDGDDVIARLAAHLDARAAGSMGRSGRVAVLASTLAGRLGLDARRAERLGRLLSLGWACPEVDNDTLDPLSRFARDRRAAAARRAASIAAAVPAYRADAPFLASSAAWHEDGPADPLVAVLALALAVDALDPHDAPRRVAAAAGTQFHPDVARVYLARIGAAT